MASASVDIYRRLLRYSRPYAGRIAFSILASLVVAGTDVSYAGLVQPLVDKIIAGGQHDLVILVPVFVIGLALLKGIGRYLQEYYIKTAGQLVIQDLRNDLQGHSLSLSMAYYGRNSTGKIMSRILNDVGMMQRSAADVLVDGVRESFTLIRLVGLVFYRDWQLAIVAFLVLPVAVLPATIIGRKIKINTRKGQSSLGNLTGHLQETFSGIKVIKAFGTEAGERHRFRTENLRFYRFLRKVLKYDSASSPIIEILASFGIATVLWYGINRVLAGAMTQGELFSFATAMFMMYTPVKRLTKVGNTIQKSLGAAERVFEVFDEAPDIADAPDAAPLAPVRGQVTFDAVGFAYRDEPVLHEFSLEARPGEIVALVGPSGAGKSTVVGLIARFYDPQKGCVRIDGQDIRQVTLDSLRENIALVDQETFLFNATIARNIRYGRPDASDEQVRAAARQAYADGFIQELPEGYETVTGDRGHSLSGGQRQRLCIARALLRDAPILILDEATSALDTESEAEVQKALANLMKNRTTFVIAHRLSTIMHADKIVVMENGRILQIGSHTDLIAQEGLYRKLYDLQFKS